MVFKEHRRQKKHALMAIRCSNFVDLDGICDRSHDLDQTDAASTNICSVRFDNLCEFIDPVVYAICTID